MNVPRSVFVLAFLLLQCSTSDPPPAPARAPMAEPSAAEREAIDVLTDAYVYGYSLITTDVTRVQMSNVPTLEAMRGPVNQFVNVKRYPPASYRGVSAPNADTLYSIAWLDLSEPIVFSHPAMGTRYYLFELVDLWMNLHESPSARTAGGSPQRYLLSGPGWSGEVPKGMKHIALPTRSVAILGRTYADGSEADYKKVNALQSQYQLVPLSAWGKKYDYQAPPVDPSPGFSMTAKPQDAILALGAKAYFARMAKLMGSDAPPAPEDALLVARMAKIGLVPGQPFDETKLAPEVRDALVELPKLALAEIEKNRASLGVVKDGWVITKGLGVYGADYMKRAVVAAFGWPANLEQDAVYPYTDVDASGQKLNGANAYTLTFPKDRTPPVHAFWSITMYAIDRGWWFVPNALNKFTVSLRDRPVFEPDGSLELYFQNASPGRDKERNWLPAPKGDFILMLRMYWPNENDPSILDETWAPPAVVKVR
jgi:hypothetical protein